MRKLTDALKDTTSITEAAKACDCSRPTLYKYIEFYEQGEYDQIPLKVRTYFASVINEDFSRAESEMSLRNLMSKREDLKKKICSLEKEVNIVQQKMSVITEELHKDPDNKMLLAKSDTLSVNLAMITHELEYCRKEYSEILSKVHQTPFGGWRTRDSVNKIGPDWIDAEIKHVCSGTNDNFVIIYEKPDSDSEVYVELYARIAGNDEYMGRYVPEQGKNFVQITGLPNTLSYSYRIVLFDDDGKHCTEYMKLNTR